MFRYVCSGMIIFKIYVVDETMSIKQTTAPRPSRLRYCLQCYNHYFHISYPFNCIRLYNILMHHVNDVSIIFLTVIRIPISIKLPLSFRKNCSTNGIFLLYHLLIDGVPRRLFFVHLSLMCCCWRAADCVSVFVLLQRAYRRSHTFIDDPNQMFFFFKYFDYFMAQRK